MHWCVFFLPPACRTFPLGLLLSGSHMEVQTTFRINLSTLSNLIRKSPYVVPSGFSWWIPDPASTSITSSCQILVKFPPSLVNIIHLHPACIWKLEWVGHHQVVVWDLVFSDFQTFILWNVCEHENQYPHGFQILALCSYRRMTFRVLGEHDKAWFTFW